MACSTVAPRHTRRLLARPCTTARAACGTRRTAQRGCNRGKERATLRHPCTSIAVHGFVHRFTSLKSSLAGAVTSAVAACLQSKCCCTHARITAHAWPHHPGRNAHAAAPTRP
jgi:hypothetical protein